MPAGAQPRPPQPPVDLPDGVHHGTRKAHRRFRCRCGPCQEWSREDDRNRAPRGKNRPLELPPETGWYVCANRWGASFPEHEYSRIGVCVRCKADRPTEEYWERIWEQQMSNDPRDMVGDNPTGRPRKSSAGKRRQEAKKEPKS